MTNEEAIRAIEAVRNIILEDPSWLKSFTDKVNEAVDMAINALTAQPETHDKRTETHSCDCISRQAAIRWVKTECNPYGKPTLDFESGKKVIEHLEQMPSIQPDSKELSFTHKALDTISRQTVIDVLDRNRILGQGLLNDTLDHIADAIMALPFAQPLVLTCDGCRHVGTYDTDFPCSGCIRREKDYYEQER